MRLKPLDFFQKLFLFNLLMVPASLVLHLITDKEAHFYMAFVWSLISLIGFFISERIMRDHPHPK